MDIKKINTINQADKSVDEKRLQNMWKTQVSKFLK